jgi:putative addiction module component (TIGR02574 family)
MSKSEILAELPRLSAQERREILERLWKLEEAAGPTSREKHLLDEAQADCDADPQAGAPWAEVESRLRHPRSGAFA